MDETLAQMEHLSVSESWSLVRSAPVGRLAVVVDGRPEIFPLNHVVDHGTLVFRTAEGTKLSGTVGHEVAYECDGLDPTGTLASTGSTRPPATPGASSSRATRTR